MPDAFTTRLYRDSDISTALSVIHAASRADAVPYLPSEADLRARLSTPLTDPRIDPVQDVFVAQTAGIGVVAYADGAMQGEAGKLLYRTQCFVQPDFRRQGIGWALLERQWRRVQELSRLLGDAKVILGTRAFDSQPDALALYEAFGMRPVRHFLLMCRDLPQGDASPGAPIPPLEVPPSLQLQTWAERRDDRAMWAAANEAFADHWGHSSEAFEAFGHRLRAGRMQPENSFIAWEGNEVAGASLNEMGTAQAARLRQNMGWIGQVFVRRAWRKRGLGRALLVASLLKARELGHTSAGLNVDAENLTGAVQLYEAVGFVRVATRTAYWRVYPEA